MKRKKLMQRLANMSNQVYSSEVRKDWNRHDQRKFYTKSEKAMTMVVDGALYISFRGSSNLQNWMDDMNITHKEHPKLKKDVPRGFYNAYSRIKSKVMTDTLKRLEEHHIQKIFATGHSLGGVMAQYFAIDLKHRSETKELFKKVVTFGQPKAGTTNFCKASNKLLGVRNHICYVMSYKHMKTDEVMHYPEYSFFSHSGTRKSVTSEKAGAKAMVKPLYLHSMEFYKSSTL